MSKLTLDKLNLPDDILSHIRALGKIKSSDVRDWKQVRIDKAKEHLHKQFLRETDIKVLLQYIDRLFNKNSPTIMIITAKNKIMRLVRKKQHPLALYIKVKSTLEKMFDIVDDRDMVFLTDKISQLQKNFLFGSGKKNNNPWLSHVAAYRKNNPGLSYKESLIGAKKTY